jgi:uncharacterized protein YegP (UPF0339 family)
MTLVILRRKRGYYWRLVARNNRVLAIGAEPFASRRAALKAAHRAVSGAYQAWSSEAGLRVEWKS